MSNSNYHRIAVGWVKKNKSNADYVSATTQSKDSKLKLFAQLEDGSTVEVTNFAMLWNQNKKQDNHPDVHFVFTTN